MSLKFCLREASLLSGASWGGVVYCSASEWRVFDAYHLSKDRLKALQQLLAQDSFAAWLTGVLKKMRSCSIKMDVSSSVICERIYAFPGEGSTLVLVGTQGILDARNQRVWRMIASLKRNIPGLPADEDVDLLQRTVTELQETQQELQARISAQREAEARLIQAAKLAAVGEMAAGVAHELNNPLTSVVGFTELALDELPVDSVVRNDLELVLKEARRARSVVRRLLDFARQAETIRVKADINEILDDVLVLTKHLMQNSKVQTDVRLGQNLPWASVDRNQIKQVALNLFNNALYAMPDGGRIVVETTEKTRFGRQWLTLSVMDNGIGISPENLERIFEPFFTTRGDSGGTGLGLSVTYGIVTDHGGMIEVESQLHTGSTFVVWLPLDQPV